MNPELKSFRLLSAGALLLGVLAPEISVAGDRMYCCHDSKGRQVCSDSLPPECYSSAYREISNRGMSVKRIDAPLTAEQKAQREADILRRQDEERQAKEQKRKDQALLETYNSERDIDAARDRATALFNDSVKVLMSRQGEALQLQKKLGLEGEFYRKKPMPPELRNQIKDNEAELASIKSTIELKRKDLDEYKAKLEDDRRRYREIIVRNASAAANKGSIRSD